MNKKIKISCIIAVIFIIIVLVFSILINTLNKKDKSQTKVESDNNENIANQSEEDTNETDQTKDFVYSAIEKDNYKYPIINIESEEIKKINDSIKRNYGFTEAEYKNKELSKNKIEEISYKYTINDNILSLVIWKAGDNSVTGTTYNIDIQKKSEIKPSEILKSKNLIESAVIAKAKKAAEKEFENTINAEKEAAGDDWSAFVSENEVEENKKALRESITKLEKLHINEEGHIYILAEYKHLGEENKCTQMITIDTEENYKVSDFETEKAIVDHMKFAKNYQPMPQQEESNIIDNNTTNNQINTTQENKTNNQNVIKIY